MNPNPEIIYEYDAEKNVKLKEERGISFEEIIYLMNNGCLLDTVAHHNTEKYAAQQFYIVDVDSYVYLVPFVKEETHIFLKTIFPSRKHTKLYLKEKANNRRSKNE
jgi:uncharacterized DUF497 family protein